MMRYYSHGLSEFTHPLMGVARPQSKFHFSNLSSLMQRQVLVGASLGEGD
jgi:hypothetical protein